MLNLLNAQELEFFASPLDETLEANVVKSDGGLRGKGANTQNVPTAAVIVLPTLLIVALKAFSGQL